MDIWIYGSDIWIKGYMDIWIYGYMAIWMYGYMDILWIYGRMDAPSDILADDVFDFELIFVSCFFLVHTNTHSKGSASIAGHLTLARARPSVEGNFLHV